MRAHIIRALAIAGALNAAALAPAVGQATKSVALNRAAIPTAGKTPELHVPSWSKLSLANGARLVVSERHGLPLIYVSVNLIGGAAQFEGGDFEATLAFGGEEGGDVGGLAREARQVVARAPGAPGGDAGAVGFPRVFRFGEPSEGVGGAAGGGEGAVEGRKIGRDHGIEPVTDVRWCAADRGG